MFKTLLLSFAVALLGCGDDSDGFEPEKPIITTSVESISAPADGGSYSITISTTGKEWGIYAEGDFIKATAQYSSNSVAVTIDENPYTIERTGNVVIMSGVSRKKITITQTAADTPAYNAPDGYTLVWHDEFDAGSELNADNWTHEVQGSGWVNNELQNYVKHITPGGALVTQVKNGSLCITALKENSKVYSGRVYAHVNEGWLYGYFEARIKLPKGRGTWPAFWMMPVGNDWSSNPWPMCGEIDIMEEVGCVPNEVSSSIHTQDYNHTKNTQKTHAMTINAAEGEFHTYALLWTADEIITYVDNVEQLHVKKSIIGSGHNQWPFHYAFYPILNLAWGGSWGGMNGVDDSALPCTMEVDYIRVFQKK